MPKGLFPGSHRGAEMTQSEYAAWKAIKNLDEQEYRQTMARLACKFFHVILVLAIPNLEYFSVYAPRGYCQREHILNQNKEILNRLKVVDELTPETREGSFKTGSF